MVEKIVDPKEEIYISIDRQEDFVLQGGAGSGKTETLKQTVKYILQEYPEKELLCITHTNLAVDEIKSRVNGNVIVSTIHSFMNELIKNFKQNIQIEMVVLFSLEEMKFSNEVDSIYEGNKYKQERHKKYKKLYENCRILSFKLLKKSLDKVPVKKEFDKEYEFDNEGNIINNLLEQKLNLKIQEINEVIKKDIMSKPTNLVHYNYSQFNDRENLGYSHDGLIELSVILIKKHKILQKILRDKFDYVLIDEYQDTDPEIIRVFIESFSSTDKTIGLFGDHMQTIYDEGVGSVKKYVDEEKLKEIVKEDNYRSSYPIVDFINNIRTDSLKQSVAFKRKSTGEFEKKSDRQGKVTFYYVLSEQNENPIEEFIKYILKDKEDYDVLMLTNRLIATELEFENLYSIFSDRGLEPMERMEVELTSLLLKELYEMINAYSNEDYNHVIGKLNYNGWKLRKVQDKIDIFNVFEELKSTDRSIYETLEFAFNKKLLRESEQYKNYIYRKDKLLKELENDQRFIDFKVLFDEGENTYLRMNKKSPGTYSEYEFIDYHKIYKRKEFYQKLFSKEIKFNEVMNYFEYSLNEGKRKTMHKTKGTGLKKVAVILDNFGWHKYNFTKMFKEESSKKEVNNSLNLFYVACSRAIESLIIMKFIKNKEELKTFKNKFKSETEIIDFVEIKKEDFI